MKRPLLVLCAAVLSGTLMGIAETEVIVRVTVAAATVAALLMAYIKSRDRSTILLFCTLFFVLFFSSFLRARAVSNRYGKEPAAAFFEQYRAANPGEFDYALYLKSQNITNEEEREKQKEDHGLQILSAKCESIFDRNLTRHDAGIFKAIVLGRKESMDEDIKNLYQKSGIAHLLTVSGLHISMIGMGTFQFLRKKLVCPPVVSLIAAVLFTFCFALFTGFQVSAVRASVMLTISLAATVIGRTYDVCSAFGFSLIS